MKESVLWTRAVKPVFGDKAHRLEVRWPKGLPDVTVNLGEGLAAWIELKLQGVRINATGRCVASTLTLEQAIWLHGWRTGGGLGGALLFDAREVRYAYVISEFRRLRQDGAQATWFGDLTRLRKRLPRLILE